MTNGYRTVSAAHEHMMFNKIFIVNHWHGIPDVVANSNSYALVTLILLTLTYPTPDPGNILHKAPYKTRGCNRLVRRGHHVFTSDSSPPYIKSHVTPCLRNPLDITPCTRVYTRRMLTYVVDIFLVMQ